MRAFAGLMWEQWRQSRAVVLLGHGAIFVFLAVAYGMQEVEGSHLGKMAVFFSWWIAILVMGLSLPNHQLRGMTMLVPSRMLVLPATMAEVLLSIILYRLLLAAALLSVLFTGEWLFSMSEDSTALMVLVLALMLWGTAFSTLGTLLGKAPAAFLTLCIPFYVMLMWIICSEKYWSTFSSIRVLLLSSGLLLAAFLMFPAINLRLRRVGPKAGAGQISEVNPASKKKSEGATSIIFELRQSLWILPAATLIFLAVALLVMLIIVQPGDQFAMLPVGVAFGMGYLLYKRTEEFPSPILLRPHTTDELARHRLMAGALAISATVVAVCLLLHLGARVSFSQFDLWWWAIILLGTWVSLFCGRILLLLFAIPCLASFLAPVSYQDVVLELVCVIGLGGLWLMLFLRGLRRGVTRWIQAVCLLVAFGLISLTFFSSHGLNLRPEHATLSFLSAVLFCLPLVWVPVALDWQRHR